MPHGIIALIALSALVLVAASAWADEDLLRIGKSFDMSQAVVAGNAKVTLVPEAEGAFLRVEAPKGAQMAGVTLLAPGGKWDLSSFTHVAADVRNVGAGLAKVRCRVANPDTDGPFNSVTDELALAPGQAGTVKVLLTRKKPQWVKVELSGMNGYPWGAGTPVGKSARWCIDPSNAVSVIIFVEKTSADTAFEIAGVRAAGRYVPPTDLLRDPAKFFPFIDEYGQYIHADWPGKTHGPEDLARCREAEAQDLSAHPGPAGWDQYGGWKDGPQLKTTGWFYVAKHEGKWWLVDPEGKPFFSHGIDCVTPREGVTTLTNRPNWFRNLPGADSEFGAFYGTRRRGFRATTPQVASTTFDFGRSNLLRKYGPNWEALFADLSHRRLRSWGLNTVGNWSDPAIYALKRTPYTATVRFGGRLLEGSQGYWGKFRDVFDPDFAPTVRDAMTAQAARTGGDPWCMGYFVDNEISWGTDDVSLAVAALVSPADQPAKRAFVEDLQAKYGSIGQLNAAWGASYISWDAIVASTEPPDASKAHDDLAAFHARTAERYFRTVREALKAADPNHLYLGCRFAWVNDAAVAAAAKYCDVVSYNLYQRSVAGFRLPVAADVPLIIGEFHFGALDRGMFHTGLVATEDQAHRAEAYKDYVHSVLDHPQFVGCHWFKYMDEPTTGRSDDENYQIGFLDIADTPYTETIDAARQIGGEMYRYRSVSK